MSTEHFLVIEVIDVAGFPAGEYRVRLTPDSEAALATADARTCGTIRLSLEARTPLHSTQVPAGLL